MNCLFLASMMQISITQDGDVSDFWFRRKVDFLHRAPGPVNDFNHLHLLLHGY